jgi:TatD DNase family protein
MTSLQTDTNDNNESKNISFIDIGANLLDDMYQGSYRGKERHEADLQNVIQRAFQNKVDKIIITCGTLQEAKDGLELAKTYPNLFCTVGVHPTRCSSEFGSTDDEWSAYVNNLKLVIDEGVVGGNVVAMGELGLDYARLQFCDVETQKKGLIAQLELAKSVNLPLFLHNRETGTDLLDLLKEYYFDSEDRAGGVVHSFDDTLELAHKFMELGLYIGINGCSLKKEENLEVVKEIPLDKLLLETDCPWCDIRASHAGFGHVQTKFPAKTEKKYEKDCFVKGRYEPIHIIQVAEVIAGIKGISVEEVATASKLNAHKLFGKMTKKGA